MSVSGVINTHFIVACDHAARHRGAEAQVPAGDGGRRGPRLVLDVGAGSASDVAAIKTKTVRDGDEYVIDGQKMWLTNGGSSTLIACWCAPTRAWTSRRRSYKKMSTILVEKPTGFGEVAPGLTIPGKIDKMGYKGVDTTEAVFEGHRVPADQVLGGETGRASTR